MPVGALDSKAAAPRKPTAFDLQRAGGRGPNDGTEWSGAGEGQNPHKIFDTGESSPARFNEYNDKGVKGDPSQRPVGQVLAERGFDCDVCKLHFAHMDTFNNHCLPDPRGNGKEIRCQVDKRLFDEKNAAEKTHMLDPNAVAVAVAEALKPTLLSIVGAFENVNKTLLAIQRGDKIEEPKPPKKPRKEGKKRANPRLARGAAPARGPEHAGALESAAEPVADPPAEPASPEQPA